MSVHLLDVNVLLALAWPNHSLHRRAHAWLHEDEGRRWATCPTTQAGFVRISCQPAVTGVPVSPAEALAVARAMTTSPRHEFWADDVPIARALAPFEGRLGGHRQITDALLLALAHRHAGRLATFDRKIEAVMDRDSPFRGALEIIPV